MKTADSSEMHEAFLIAIKNLWFLTLVRRWSASPASCQKQSFWALSNFRLLKNSEIFRAKCTGKLTISKIYDFWRPSEIFDSRGLGRGECHLRQNCTRTSVSTQ